MFGMKQVYIGENGYGDGWKGIVKQARKWKRSLVREDIN